MGEILEGKTTGYSRIIKGRKALGKCLVKMIVKVILYFLSCAHISYSFLLGFLRKTEVFSYSVVSRAFTAWLGAPRGFPSPNNNK